MAGDLVDSGTDSFWSRRLLEWTIVAGVVLSVTLLLIRQAHEVKGQAELANVRTTLAALRTALVIEHLKQSADQSDPVATLAGGNPFALLQNRPMNYAGVMNSRDVEGLPPGTWMFGPDCVCLAYRPLDDTWFFSPDGSGVAWFQVSAPPRPPLISARVAYRWRMESLE